MNKSILLGRLTGLPEIRYSQANNMKVATFTLAVNRKYTKPGEERQADFINIVAWNKLADFAEKYNQNPNRFHKFTGIFSNMYDAAHKNGNIIKPFGQKNGFNNGSATK